MGITSRVPTSDGTPIQVEAACCLHCGILVVSSGFHYFPAEYGSGTCGLPVLMLESPRLWRPG